MEALLKVMVWVFLREWSRMWSPKVGSPTTARQ